MWIWGSVAAVLIVVMIGGFLFWGGGNSSDQPFPEEKALPTSLLVNPTSTHLPIQASATSTTTPDPSSGLPIGLSVFLNDLEIIESDDFSQQTDMWGTSQSGLQWDDGFVQMTGIPVFMTYIFRPSNFNAGQGVLLLFEYPTSDLDVNMLLEQGGWDTPNYRRLGINLQEEAVVDIYNGTESTWGEPLEGSVKLIHAKSYYVLLALDSSKIFSAVLGEADNPNTYNIFRLDPTPELPSNGWSISIQVDEGEIWLDKYYLLSFE